MMHFQISISILIIIITTSCLAFISLKLHFPFCKPNSEQFGRLRVNKFNDNSAGGRRCIQQAKKVNHSCVLRTDNSLIKKKKKERWLQKWDLLRLHYCPQRRRSCGSCHLRRDSLLVQSP